MSKILMTDKKKELLLKDLCARLPYGVKVLYEGQVKEIQYIEPLYNELKLLDDFSNYTIGIEDIKPYLRPMSSMTEEEAKEIATLSLYCLKNILSVKITDEYIDLIIDDGFSSTERITLWYDELITSIECFDWLNKNHFDYRGLIPNGLAIEVTKDNNPYKE